MRPAWVLLIALIGCQPIKGSRHDSNTPAASASASTSGGSAETLPTGSRTPNSGANTAIATMAWMLGKWTCDINVREGSGSASTLQGRGHGRLVVDTYMLVWIGAGFEPDEPSPSVPIGDFYFTYDTAARSWTLLGFMSDGAHYALSSPGELEGRIDWTGSMSKGGQKSDLRGTWSHKGEGELEIRLDRKLPLQEVSTTWKCGRQP